MAKVGSGQISDQELGRRHWRWAILIAMAAYLDAGSMVAGAIALPLWAEEFGLGTGTVGLIAAFSSSGISTGIGALIGGPLGDRFGRKKIYTIDLIFYAVGVLIVVLAPSAAVVIIGYVVVGLAVGIDIPTSFSLLAEIAPTKGRSKLFALGPAMWYVGPLVVFALAIFLVEPFGLTGARIVFAHLILAALLTWILRLGIPESERWSRTQSAEPTDPAVAAPGSNAVRKRRDAYRQLFSRRNAGALAFIAGMFTVWSIPAGTYGLFLPTFLQNLGANSATESYLYSALTFAVGLPTVVAFAIYGDRIKRGTVFAASAVLGVVGFAVLVIFPISSATASLTNIILLALANGSMFCVLQVWSAELFPTSVRSTLQGVTIAVSRVALGLWSLWVVGLAENFSFNVVAIALGAMFLVMLVIGGLLGPSTQGKSLEEIEKMKLFGARD